MEKVRLQKILSQSGISSRREAERLIADGLITINGKVAKLGDKALPGKDHIKVKGKLLKLTPQTPVYLAFYKPKGVIAMVNLDPEGRPTIKDYLSKTIPSHIFPIGRMDYNGEGLMLLTNDGDVAEKIQKHKNIVRKYEVKIKYHPDAEMMARIGRGFRVSGKFIKPHSVRFAQKLKSKSIIEVMFLGSGALELKEFFTGVGFLVEKVTRTQFGHLTLKGLTPGKYKSLTKAQMDALIDHPELGLKDQEERDLTPQPGEELQLSGRERGRTGGRPEGRAGGRSGTRPRS